MRKHFPILTFFLFLTSTLNAQINLDSLPPLLDVMKQIAVGRNTYELGETFESKYFSLKTCEDAAQIFRNCLHSPVKRASTQETNFLKTVEEEAVDIIYSMPAGINSIQNGIYVADAFLSPVRAIKKSDGAGIIFTGITSKTVYNSFKLSARERASRTISDIILPCIKKLKKLLADSNIRYIGIAVYSPTRDLTDKNSDDVAELVSVVASSKDCVAYLSSNLTEDEFLDHSDIFNADKDLYDDVRKIKLTLR
jgi:hypothetical protein